jgi:hypothetical protein
MFFLSCLGCSYINGPWGAAETKSVVRVPGVGVHTGTHRVAVY